MGLFTSDFITLDLLCELWRVNFWRKYFLYCESNLQLDKNEHYVIRKTHWEKRLFFFTFDHTSISHGSKLSGNIELIESPRIWGMTYDFKISFS